MRALESRIKAEVEPLGISVEAVSFSPSDDGADRIMIVMEVLPDSLKTEAEQVDDIFGAIIAGFNGPELSPEAQRAEDYRSAKRKAIEDFLKGSDG
jgi:hypothetical protein